MKSMPIVGLYIEKSMYMLIAIKYIVNKAINYGWFSDSLVA